MPRAILNLQDSDVLTEVGGVWRFAPGFIPGQKNEGFESEIEGSPARLGDFFKRLPVPHVCGDSQSEG